MFISNEMNYGHLIDPENFNISLTQPELYEVFNNVKVNSFQNYLMDTEHCLKDWKARYLHPDYQKSLEPNATIEQVRRLMSSLKCIPLLCSHAEMCIGFHFYPTNSRVVLSISWKHTINGRELQMWYDRH